MIDRSISRPVSNRRGIIGGSSLSLLDDTVSWGCKRRLAYQFLGFEPSEDKEYNEAMKLGHFFEPQLRNWFAEQYKVSCVESEFVIHPEYPFIGGHPDGIFGNNGIIEIKTASPGSFRNLKNKKIYEAYQDQLTLYMSITERYEAYFVVGCYIDISKKFIQKFSFDENRSENIITKIVDFVSEIEFDLPKRKGTRGHGLISVCNSCEFRTTCSPKCLNTL